MGDMTLWMYVGFLLAAYSVIWNDSIQTLGTFIASNGKKFKWQYLWGAASAVLIFTILHSWVGTGDISHGRLAKIPFVQVQWYHAMAPLILVFLTRYGIPVSTSFLVLSAFASKLVMTKMLTKSMLGYAVAAVVAYVLWLAITKFFKEEKPIAPEHETRWRVALWCTTGFLWYTWLAHDMSNIAVFLPRKVTPPLLVFVIATLVAGLAYIFWKRGGKIQQVVLEKSHTSYVKSATFIDLVYALLLLYFKQYNNIPMSTTWVFVGLLCGRELAMATIRKDYELKEVFPLVLRDFLKILFGLAISVGIAISIHYWF